jgi:hypothetical protein
MKKLFLIAIVSLVYSIGYAIGTELHVNPILSGLAVTAISCVGLAPKGSLFAGLDISAINTELGAYWRVYQKEIWRKLFTELELEKYMRKVPNVTDEYVVPSSSNTELLQPFQKAWTPKGSVAFDARINKVRQIKIDYLLDSMDEIYRSYLAFMADETTERKNWPLVKYIVMNHIIPGMREELNQISATGNYAAPTPGTAGAYLTSTDGILTIVADEITATNLTPITTGVVTQSDALDKFETFNDSMPVKYRDMAGVILCSATLARYYQRDYRANFGSFNALDSKDNLKLDATKKVIVGLECFEGSQRMLFTPQNNLLCMYDKIDVPSSFEFQVENRTVKILGDFKRGYGFGNLSEVFVNDQA